MQHAIRTAVKTDAAILSEFCARTFYDTYASENTKADMQLFQDTHFTQSHMLAEIDSTDGRTFMAYLEHELIGYARVSPGKQPKELENRKSLEVERIYVSKNRQGHKMGAKLIAHCIDYARVNGYEVLWLGVWEYNFKAIGFYTRLGFEKFGEQGFLLGTDLQHDHMMKLELGPRTIIAGAL